ncbi:hypothetical protein [Halolamina salifodinae]|uniref:Uncharacterized protein n=1 Tax=Halolamina salifodinae TaxID=1202767 RepID=A0A8T4H0S9_9EURY|nr:hypothetical protein [Halolamina salifodinae]MBP1987394.1 hypothetical protein [Halolamina salifodinae]
MDEATARRLALLATGVALAAVATTLARFVLVGEGVGAAEPFAVVVGLGVAMPVFLAGAYPVTQQGVEGRTRAVLALAEAGGGIAVGALAVVILLPPTLPNFLPVGGGAASTYLGATAARAVVLSRDSGPRENDA